MKSRIKNWLISVLFRLLDSPEDTPMDEKTEKLLEKWLQETYQHPGFAIYIRQRTNRFYKHLSGGLGMKELPRDDYVRGIGQRFENALLAHSAKKAFRKKEKTK